ncbi:pyocin knob domain-containing protein [Paenibacillus dendritiformis]|uniref:pyocin knob domain-containing protein n=1 Tax=Paenibacillus dendritiformis TaxID=130049 RepID=UPI000DA7CD50|nr:pyocin knob domain-containing protein [Paenibacillus dendritiformis]PZM67505.1 hypothetical protein DOE73_01505 [Paenibacillus dendritiformis]
MPYEAKTDWKYDDLVTEKDMNRIEQGLKDAHVPAYQPLTLNPGLQVVEAENDTPFRMGEVKGRTLVNLLGRAGACDNAELWTDYQTTHTIDQTLCVSPKGASGGSAVTKTKVLFEAEKFYLLIGKAKVGTATTASLSVSGYMEDTKTQAASNKEFQVLYKAIANFSTPDTRGINANVIGGDGVTAYFDDVRLYEISQAEYEIIVSKTPEQVAAKYPYVDGITNVTNPYAIVTGGNLLPPFSDGWYALTDTHLMLISPYEAVMQISTSAQTGIHIPAFPVLPNTDYTYSAEHNAGLNIFGVESGTALVSNFKGSQVTFNTGNNTRINVAFVNGDSAGGTPGTYSIKNPILTVGTEPKPFARQQCSTLGFETQLAAHPVDGSNPDTLFMGDDGLPYVMEKWGKLNFDELPASALSVGGGNGSFKQINLRRVMKNPVYKSQIAVKFDGTMLVPSTEVLKSADGLYIGDNYIDINNVYITVRNTDSGWGADYKPELDEMKAYFLGWKMYHVESNDYKSVYNGTGTKRWVSLVDWSTLSPVGVTPSEVAPGYTPYRLQYLKAKPTVEPVRNYELGATLTAGSNIVEVGSGIVIRERANPSVNIGWNHAVINRVDGGHGHLKHRVNKFYGVYRNEAADKKWVEDSQGGLAYGLKAMVTDRHLFDPTAVYHVTYTMLDPTLAAPISGTVATNLRGTVSDLIRAVNLLESEISVIDAPVKSVNGKTGDVALTADDVGAATRAEFNDLKTTVAFSRGYVTPGTDLNSLVTPGTYRLGSAKDYKNIPPGLDWTVLDVIAPYGPNVSSYIVQMIYGVLGDAVYKRTRTETAWGAWVKVPNQKDIDDLKSSVVDGKGKVAEAINGKGGGPVSANSTFDQLSAAIRGIRQATGSLDLTAGFLDNYRVGQTSTPQVNDGKTFINANNNFLFIAFTYDTTERTYHPMLREVTPSGTVVKTTFLGGPVLNLETFDVGWGLVGEGVAVFSTSDANGDYIHAYTHTGTLLKKVTNTQTRLRYTRDVCMVGSNIFMLNGYGPVEINDISGTKFFEVPNTASGVSTYGVAQFLSNTKAVVATYSSPSTCYLSMITRNGTSFSAATGATEIPYRKVYSLIASYAYR